MLRTNLEQQLAAAEAAHAQDTASHARKLKKLDERRAEAEAEADALRGRLTKVGFAGSGGKLDGVAPSTSSSGAETEKKRGSAGEEQPNDAQYALCFILSRSSFLLSFSVIAYINKTQVCNRQGLALCEARRTTHRVGAVFAGGEGIAGGEGR